MNKSFSDKRKIGSVNRKNLSYSNNYSSGNGPSQLAYSEWQKAGLKLPNLSKMRRYRLDRIIEKLANANLDGILLFDPLNIRYATDTTNMQLWNTHNPFRACLVTASGYMVVWDYKNSPFLCDFNPLVKEVRSGASMFYFASGDKTTEAAKNFASQVKELIAKHGSSNLCLAVDKIMIDGLKALEKEKFLISNGEVVMEHARSIKGPDDLLAMRCAMHACERSVSAMEAKVKPGLSENEIWSVLHAENIKRGGEWIETRLLTSGQRTNPWFQECGPRILENNEILAFDTDLIGCYGICSDISRTWWVGDKNPRKDMIYAMNHAVDHIRENMALLKPGVSFNELTFGGHHLNEKFQELKYSCKMHGVGLCDEWPLIAYPNEWVDGAYDGHLEPGMVLCVEALVSEKGNDFSIKLEDQVLITEKGFENLTTYPFDQYLLGNK